MAIRLAVPVVHVDLWLHEGITFSREILRSVVATDLPIVNGCILVSGVVDGDSVEFA